MAYVVSEDSDLRGCCSESGPLIYADSIGQIISQATVSQELHDALEKALRSSEYLSERLAEDIKYLEVETSRSSLYGRGCIEGATIVDVHTVNITSVNILENKAQVFTCEPEVETEISLDIDVYMEGYYGHRGPDDYEPSRRFSISQLRTEYFYPEIVVRFEPSTGELDFKSVSWNAQTVEVGTSDVEGHLR
jgi:hypothetical protein